MKSLWLEGENFDVSPYTNMLVSKPSGPTQTIVDPTLASGIKFASGMHGLGSFWVCQCHV